MRARDKNLTVLSETEWLALYGLPDFDDFQRAEYFALTDDELALVYRRQSLPEQVLCLLQTGYFKAKQAFFHPGRGAARGHRLPGAALFPGPGVFASTGPQGGILPPAQ